MCGRFTLRTPAANVAETFAVELPLFEPRYNIAPTQPILAIRAAERGGREGVLLRWGLVPPWAEDLSIGNRMINARSETAADKPSFRKPLARRRCLVPCDGFYEWQAQGKHKQPFYIHRRDDRPLAIAGLWERWDRGQGPVESCALLTTSANAVMSPLHDRMPVLLDARDWGTWLDPQLQDAAALQPLLRPCPDDWLEAYPVASAVNNPRHQGAELIARI